MKGPAGADTGGGGWGRWPGDGAGLRAARAPRRGARPAGRAVRREVAMAPSGAIWGVRVGDAWGRGVDEQRSGMGFSIKTTHSWKGKGKPLTNKCTTGAHVLRT